jgi:hypothetical protein
MMPVLKKREHLNLLVVGRPMDGAGDRAKMGRSRLLSERYLPNRRARSQHHQSPNADRRILCAGHDARFGNVRLQSDHYRIPRQSSVALQDPPLHAVDEEAVHLVVLGMQQDRSAVSAQIVNGVRTGDENGRCFHCILHAPGLHHFQCSSWILHGRLSSVLSP